MLQNLTSVVDNDFECVSIELHTFNRKTTIISSIYRQPDGKIDDLLKKMEHLFKNNKSNIYLYGHFNVNLLNHGQHIETTIFSH